MGDIMGYGGCSVKSWSSWNHHGCFITKSWSMRWFWNYSHDLGQMIFWFDIYIYIKTQCYLSHDHSHDSGYIPWLHLYVYIYSQPNDILVCLNMGFITIWWFTHWFLSRFPRENVIMTAHCKLIAWQKCMANFTSCQWPTKHWRSKTQVMLQLLQTIHGDTWEDPFWIANLFHL